MSLLDLLTIGLLLIGAVFCWRRPAVGRQRGLVATGLLLMAIAALAGLAGRWQALPALLSGGLLLVWALLTRPHAMATRRGAGAVAAGALLLMTGVASGLLFAVFPVSPLPSPTGPLAVGTLEFELTDPQRPMGAGASPEAARRFTVRAWYPAEPDDPAPTRPYYTRDEAEIYGAAFAKMLGLPGFLWRHLQLVDTHSQVDARLATARGPFPVIVFNHGYWSYPTQNTPLMEQLASHGYLVFSLSHPGDSINVRFADGTLIGPDPARVTRILTQEELQTSLHKYFTSVDPAERYRALQRVPEETRGMLMLESIEPWYRDTELLLDLLETGGLTGRARELGAAADLQRLGVMGMSWGGSMAGTVCLRDPRCKAAVNLDGMAWDWRLIDADLPVPFLMLQSDVRRMFPHIEGPLPARQDFMYERLAQAGERPDVYRIEMPGTTHGDFSDMTLFTRQPVKTRLARLGIVPGARVFVAQRDLVLDFFETHLRGRSLGFPDATLARTPEAQRHDVHYLGTWYREQGPGKITAPAAAP